MSRRLQAQRDRLEAVRERRVLTDPRRPLLELSRRVYEATDRLLRAAKSSLRHAPTGWSWPRAICARRIRPHARGRTVAAWTISRGSWTAPSRAASTAGVTGSPGWPAG